MRDITNGIIERKQEVINFEENQINILKFLQGKYDKILRNEQVIIDACEKGGIKVEKEKLRFVLTLTSTFPEKYDIYSKLKISLRGECTGWLNPMKFNDTKVYRKQRKETAIKIEHLIKENLPFESFKCEVFVNEFSLEENSRANGNVFPMLDIYVN